MNIAPLQRQIDASEIPMEQLSGNGLLSQDQKIGEATRQFEAVLLRQILDSMQKTEIQSKYSDNSTAAGIYRDMVTNQLADSISKSGTLGLAKTLKHEFTRQLRSSATAPAPGVSARAALTDATAETTRAVFYSAKYSDQFKPLATHP